MKILSKKLVTVFASTAMIIGMTISVSAASSDVYKCSKCDTTTNSNLDVTSTTAVATTSINVRQSVSASISASYYEKGTTTVKNTGNGNGNLSGVRTSVYNLGGTWITVDSNHSKCCSGSYTHLTW